MATRPTAKDVTFYLYVGSQWTGPYPLEAIREYLHHGQVAADTYAYDPYEQRHYTVGELLAAASGDAFDSAATVGQGSGSRVTSSLSIQDLEESEFSPASTATFDGVDANLRAFYHAFLDLAEDRGTDTGTALATLRRCYRDIAAGLALDDGDQRRVLANDVERIADYLANRHQDPRLWELLASLRETPVDEVETIAKAASDIINHLVQSGEKQGAGSQAHRNDGTTRRIIASAASEISSTQRDLESIQQAYSALQERHALDLEQARELLAQVELHRDDEAQAHAQSKAEVRGLAAEVYRLASEVAEANHDTALGDEVARLGADLLEADPSTIAPIAEGLLIRMVARLRSLAAAPGAQAEGSVLAELRAELAEVRAELVQSRAQVQALNEERERLRRQLEEQRTAAERAGAASREREQRLRSTVTALEVTRELHQEMMGDLQGQLASAQSRVEVMEQELGGVRGELQEARTGVDERSQDLQDEMRRLVEMRAMLEARRQELGTNLRDAEATLAQAGGAEAGVANEALVAKIAHLKAMSEATNRRLHEQESQAAKLESELLASRQEASELRGRSDVLSTDLEEARAGLAQARRRVDELHRAYTRLETEREELQSDLNHKGTDTIERKDTKDGSERLHQSPSARMNRVLGHLEGRLAEANRKAEHLATQLTEERQRADTLASEQASIASRIEELTADRDHLRSEFDRLHSDHFADQTRNAAQVAIATQSAIEAERRYKEAMQKVFELENRLSELDLPLSDASDESHTSILRRELIQAQEDRDRALGELDQRDEPDLDPAAKAAEIARLKLLAADHELASAVSTRDELQTRLMATLGERDRFERELARLRNEQESAAVEHRTALKSARDRLTDSQAKLVIVEAELEQAKSKAGSSRTGTETRLRAEQAYIQSLENRLADALVDHESMHDRVRALEHDLVVARASSGNDRSNRANDLGLAAGVLQAEQARVSELTRANERARIEAIAAEDRAERNHRALIEAQTERDRLQLEITRMTGEVARLSARGDVQDRLAEVMADRDHLLAELERSNLELTDLRRRLARSEREGAVAGRLQSERAHMRALEQEIAAAQEHAAAQQTQVEELTTRLAAVTAERDQLADEIERLKLAPVADQVMQELLELRAKLVKAKRRIRLLRQQRDVARMGEESVTGVTRAIDGAQPPTSRQGAAVGTFSPAPDQSAAGRPAFAPSEAGPQAVGLTRRIPSERHAAAPQNSNAGPRVAVFAPGTSGFRQNLPGHLPGTGRMRPPPPPFDPRLLTSRTAMPLDMRLRIHLPIVLWSMAGLFLLVVAILVVNQIPAAGRGEVTAHVQRVTAPISGSVTYSGQKGVLVLAGDQLALIHNDKLDRSSLDAIAARRTALDARRLAIAAEIETLSHIVPAAAPTGATQDELAVLRDRERDRQQRLTALGSESHEIGIKIASLANESAAEENRLAALTEARVTIHFDSKITETMAKDGQTVREGTDIASVTEPASVAVLALLSDKTADAVMVGDQVLVSIAGGAAMHGMVAEVVPADPSSPIGVRARIHVPGLTGKVDQVGQQARIILLGVAPNPLAKALGYFRAW